ncbi:LAFA_0F09494g1_1 [Lachancea sp. 'fantastica']|nr:LAFA_0F09494g1_1 [Lachancea sp. 'fantastica']
MDQLKLELKKFERRFEKKHGRPPARDDIRALPDLKYKYKQYAALQRERQRVNVLQVTPRRNVEDETDLPLEIGPTPQMYGKVLGLFDMKMSSPTKGVAVMSPEGSIDNLGADQSNQRSPLRNGVKTQHLDLTVSSRLSPQKRPYGPNSPFKFDGVELSVLTPRRNLQNLIAETESFGNVSPSPIIKRPMGKPLLQIVRESEKLMEDADELSDDDVISRSVKDVFQNDEEQQEDPTTEDESEVIFKRAKRKHILRPAATGLSTSDTIQVNIKEEMARLKQQAIDEANGIETTSTTITQTSSKATSTTTRKRPQKYNLVSNNFRRLKLPKAKGKGRKWGRR